jgi:type III restriction enzyme
MTQSPSTLNSTILEPLFAPWAEPNAHRVRAEKAGDPAVIVQGRRASPIDLVSNLRSAVRDWREAFYIGASDTTIQLLNHWFGRAHRQITPDGEDFEFRYYFCQREAIETLIYLKEFRRIECLSQIIAEFGGANAELQALGITEEEDNWSRYAFKLATGAGKTKVMSLCIVWSYFHALRESDSELARHFVVIAPNLTVYERLKDDFGNGHVFDMPPIKSPNASKAIRYLSNSTAKPSTCTPTSKANSKKSAKAPTLVTNLSKTKKPSTTTTSKPCVNSAANLTATPVPTSVLSPC